MRRKPPKSRAQRANLPTRAPRLRAGRNAERGVERARGAIHAVARRSRSEMQVGTALASRLRECFVEPAPHAPWMPGRQRADGEGENSVVVLPVLLVLGGLWADPPIASEGVLRTCTRLVRGAFCRALD